MGSHTNYYTLIHHLILHKEEFGRLKKTKYQDILQELSRYTLEPNSDNEDVPDHMMFAKALGFKQNRINSLLKEIYLDLIENIYFEPLVIKRYYHTIHIALDPDEFYGSPMENIKKATEQATTITMVLPITPQLGDEIEIPIVSETGNYSRGYVHRIHHRIMGHIQEIFLWVHPWNDNYYKWAKMKDEYERMKKREEYERNRSKY